MQRGAHQPTTSEGATGVSVLPRIKQKRPEHEHWRKQISTLQKNRQGFSTHFQLWCFLMKCQHLFPYVHQLGMIVLRFCELHTESDHIEWNAKTEHVNTWTTLQPSSTGTFQFLLYVHTLNSLVQDFIQLLAGFWNHWFNSVEEGWSVVHVLQCRKDLSLSKKKLKL